MPLRSREYNVQCVVSRPRVRYRETITEETSFDYTLKKQTGGAGMSTSAVFSIKCGDSVARSF